MVRRLFALLALLLAKDVAAQTSGLDCRPQSHVVCEVGEGCRTWDSPPIEVTFWPDPAPIETCRASPCPPGPPTIRYCGPLICGSGTVTFVHEGWPYIDHIAKGVAKIAPEPPPRDSASMYFALSFDAEGKRLAMSRLYADALMTTWFACEAMTESEN